jgi:hypothetical protein
MLRNYYYYQAKSVLLWADKSGKQHIESLLLAKVLWRALLRSLGKEINISTIRHLIIAFRRKINGAEGILHKLSREEVEEITDKAEAESQEMQARHLPEIATAVYAIDVSTMFSRKFHQASAHFKTSTRWYRALSFTADDFAPPLTTATLIAVARQTKREGANYTKLL